MYFTFSEKIVNSNSNCNFDLYQSYLVVKRIIQTVMSKGVSFAVL